MLLTIPPKTGNPQYTLHDQGIFNSGCSRHMTRNKSFLTYYQEIDDGFFWNTAHSQIVNDVKQIHATVDGKIIVISESSVRSDLYFHDKDGITCLTNDAIFENLALMGVPIPNVADEAVFKEWDDRVVRATTTAASLDAAQASDRPRCQKAMGGFIAQTRSKRASKHSYDSLLLGVNTAGSDEEIFEQHELMDNVPPTPHDSPLSGGHTPGSDKDLVIQKLKKKVKRLEKKLRARTSGMKLFMIGTSKKKNLDKENVSKQGRKSDKIKPMFEDSDFAELDMENVEGDAETQGRNTAEHGDTINTTSIDVSAAGPSNVSTADPSTSTTGDIFKDEMMTIADTLVAIRSTRPRTTSVVIHDIEEEPRRETLAPIVQREKAIEQEAKDAVLIKQIEDIQARIDVDELLAERLQQEEREQFTIEEKSRMLRLKRAGQEVLEEPVKRQKIGEASGSGEEQSTEKEKELSEEGLQKLLVVVPVEEVYVEALQIFAEMLKKFDRDNLVKLWDLIKERFSTTKPTDDKEKELLYDTCSVHHVSLARGHDIFMLVEKDYP
ncbi:hypothetical protein Tco_1340524 [Tanacetum coccineum]